MKHRTYVIAAAAALLLAGACFAGSAEPKVKAADLATLGADRLQALMDEDHALANARIFLDASRQQESAAKTDVKESARQLSAEKADKKAADAELKAAKKNQDAERTRLAEAQVETARRDLQAAKARVQWSEQMVKLRGAEIKKAAALLELREAELEFARAELIAESQRPEPSTYPLSEFQGRMNERKIAYERATSVADQELAKAERLRAAWTELAQKPATTPAS